MKDAGHDETNKVLDEIEKRIAKEYKQAEKEVAVKLGEYLRKFEIKDELKKRALENGLITEDEYKQWRIGQVMIGKRWAEMRDTLAQDFTNASQIAKSIAFDHMPEVYAINHDYGTFQVEKASLVDTSYTLYDRQALEELVKNEDKFIPAPGRKITRAINEGKQLAWDRKQVQSVMMQGLLQGESIPKLATRLANAVGESDRKAAVRNARTMTTGVQNAGRVASYRRANDMGIETRKQWLATLDDRTRHWHASLDGETVDYDEPFENELGEIMYPGDPAADPGNIFNCRCTLIPSIKGFERDVSDMNLRHDDHLKDMTYDEWRAGHYEQRSDSITKQDDIAERMQNAYNAEYRKYSLTENKNDGTMDLSTISANIEMIQSRNNALGNPSAILQFDVDLNNRQQKLLESLPEFGSKVIVKKNDVSMKDLSALTAKTGVEFAMFSKNGERLIMRGNTIRVPVNQIGAAELAEQGYRWAGHTHPGDSILCLKASPGDKLVLEKFDQEQSVIYNSKGQFEVFGKE